MKENRKNKMGQEVKYQLTGWALFIIHLKSMHLYRLLMIPLCVCFTATLLVSCTLKKPPVPAKSAEEARTTEYERLIDQGQSLINEREHKKAIVVLKQAGKIMPDRPEWLYEKSEALFFMDQFAESVQASRQALDRVPDDYDALTLNWSARMEAAKNSAKIKKTVRAEIDALMKKSGDNIKAILAAYQGYGFLWEQADEQRLILDLAKRSPTAAPDDRDTIGSELLEQIIAAKKMPQAQLKLMDAYLVYFPERIMVEFVVAKVLSEKEKSARDAADPMAVIQSILKTKTAGVRIKTGVAKWLIEQDKDKRPHEAVRLLRQSLTAVNKSPEKRPAFYTDALWQEALDKQKDYIRYLLGRAWFETGDFKKAETELDAVAKNNRQWDRVYHFLGEIALHNKKPEQAISCFRRALEINSHADDTEKLLTGLLYKYHGYQGDPALYFCRQTKCVHFSDVTKQAGLADIAAHRLAWGDYNRDGFIDLLVDGHRLFQNTGNTTFVEVTKAAGLAFLKRANGGIWGDYNNDGFPDIFVMDHSGNHLMKNNGDGIFIDVTASALGPMSPCQTEAAAWGDPDNDGFLDIYAANYERHGVTRGLGVQDQLYHNNGNGAFTDISKRAGIITDQAMCGRGVTWTDVNHDGYQDIVVANYRLAPNFLWINNRTGGFIDEAGAFGVRGKMVAGYFGHSVGPVSGDLNNDGMLDLFITNLAHPRFIEYSDKDMLLINNGPPDYHYANQYAGSGIFFEETGSDPALADVDNDGDLDLYITSIYKGRYSHLYVNDGKAHFTDVTWMSGVSVGNSWGAAFADFNNDGHIDLVVASEDGLHLFENNGNADHWLKVKIEDGRCNRLGIGSLVTILYAGRRQIREVCAGRGSGSEDDTTLLFGLGDYDGPVDISAHTLCGSALLKTVLHPDQTVVLKNGPAPLPYQADGPFFSGSAPNGAPKSFNLRVSGLDSSVSPEYRIGPGRR